MIIVLSLTGFYRIIAHSNQISSYDEDIYIAAKQVSQYAIGSCYEEVDDSYTYYNFEQEEVTFELNNRRLVKTPGFEIMLTNIDNLYFVIENNNIYMNIERSEREYRFLVNYAKEKEEEEKDSSSQFL